MGDADTGNDHLSDVDLPSQSALASLAEQPGDAAAKPRPSRQALERKKIRLLTICSEPVDVLSPWQSASAMPTSLLSL